MMLFSNYRDFVMEFPGNSLDPLPHLLCFNAGDIWLFSKAQDCFFTDPLFSASLVMVYRDTEILP